MLQNTQDIPKTRSPSPRLPHTEITFMLEQSKSAKRRYDDGQFHSKYFVGRGIDIGAGKDSLFLHMNVFRGMTKIDS